MRPDQVAVTPLAIAVLRTARAKIADPAHWVREWLAADAQGKKVAPTDPTAVRWCALGAMRSLQGQAGHLAAWHALYKACDFTSVAYVNDVEGHEAVLALYDRAIALLEYPA